LFINKLKPNLNTFKLILQCHWNAHDFNAPCNFKECCHLGWTSWN